MLTRLRSLLYYLFLAAIIIFINILRNTRHPKSREDLRSLNMAVTFFTTLIPGDGVYNNAKFMANMCAVLERIAKMVIEKEERNLKSRKADRTLLSGKRSSVQNSPSSQPQDVADHPPGQNGQEATQIASPPESTSRIQISDTDGLSPTNSSEHATPESSPDFGDFSQGNVPDCGPVPELAQAPQYVEQAAATLNYPSTTPDAYPFSNNMFMSPDLWQIPLTAGWELPNQFPGNVFGQGYSEAYGPEAFAPSVPVAPEQTENGDTIQYMNQGNMWSNASWNYGYDLNQWAQSG